MIKKIAVLAVILVFSGCICCGGNNIQDLIPGQTTTPDGSSEEGSDTTGSNDGESQCESPYISSGAGDCCLDRDDNSVCDSEEQDGQTEGSETGETGTETTQTTQTPNANQATANTLSSSGNTATTATTIRTQAATYACVQAAGYNPDHVIFGYSQNCGQKFIPTASAVSIEKGVDIDAINIGGLIDDNKIKMLECFYGKYSESNLMFKQCPVLLCPRTGETKVLSNQGGQVKSQMQGFALKCD